VAGLTIIHLSDIHLGELQDEDPTFETMAQFTAKSLANDFQKVAKENFLSTRPDEILLVITGDITDIPTLDNYKNAVYFIKLLQKQLSKFMEGGEFPSDHIICIPGNHDIEIPHQQQANTLNLIKEKYRNYCPVLKNIVSGRQNSCL
jgi:3',5'-cyclic AMP phosphodiesterase CpdA